MVALFAVRQQGVISVSVVLQRGVMVVIQGVIVIIRCGHRRTWAGHHCLGGRLFHVTFAGGTQSSFVGARSSFVGPVVVDVGCRSVVVGPQSPLMVWHPRGHLSVVGGVCRQSLSMGGQFSSSMGSHHPFVGGHCSWVDGHSWVVEIVVHGWGMVVISGGVVIRHRGALRSWAFIVQKAAVDVERPDGHAMSAVWWWCCLLGTIAVAVSIVVVSRHCQHCCCQRWCELLCGGGGDG